jgi:hypothetical protein
MANISTFLEEELLDHVFRNAAYSSPTTVFLGIADNSATDLEMEAGTLTNEITGYTGDRKAITFTAPTQVGGKGTVENTADISFEDMPAVTVDYAFVADAATAGNILFWMPLTTPRTVGAGATLTFEAGEVVLDLD